MAKQKKQTSRQASLFSIFLLNKTNTLSEPVKKTLTTIAKSNTETPLIITTNEAAANEIYSITGQQPIIRSIGSSNQEYADNKIDHIDSKYILFIDADQLNAPLNLNELLTPKKDSYSPEHINLPFFTDAEFDYKKLNATNSPLFIISKERFSYLLLVSENKESLYKQEWEQILKKSRLRIKKISFPGHPPYELPHPKKPFLFNLSIWIKWYLILPFKEFKEKPEKKYSFIKVNPIYRALFVLAALAMLISMPIMSLDAGISGDEHSIVKQVEKVYKYYATMGENTEMFDKPSERVLPYYGFSFDLIAHTLAEWFNIENYYEFRHILNTLTGWLSILFCGLLATLIGGWRAGFITLLLMFLSPRFLGHTWNNPKDIPFAMSFIFGIYFIIKFIKELPLPKNSTLFGIALGIAMAISIRIGGLLLIAYAFAFAGLYYLSSQKPKDWLKGPSLNKARKIIIYLLIASITGYLAGLLLWPYGFKNPISNPLKALDLMTNFSVSLRQTFEGSIIWSDNAPWYYALKYIAISTPVLLLTGFGLIILTLPWIRKQYNPLFVFALFFSFLFPVIYIIYKDSNVYGGWRHVLFAYPALVALSGLGFEVVFRKLKSSKYHIALWVVILGLAVHPVKHYIKNHPYQYIYFNELFGGVKNAFGDYELDYYFHSLKEGSEWLIDNKIPTAKPDDPPVIATNHGPIVRYYFRHLIDSGKAKVRYVRYYNRSEKKWDYGVFANSYISPGQQEKGLWPPQNTIHTIKVDGQPAGAVIERATHRDYQAYQATKNKNYNKAIMLYSEALQKDPNNSSTLTLLTQAYLQANYYKQAEATAKKALKAYPKYDQAYYLLGNAYLNQGKFKPAIKAYENAIKQNYKFSYAYYFAGIAYLQSQQPYNAINRLRNCISINPRFKQAYQMLSQAYKQTGQDQQAQQVLNMAKRIK